MTCKHRLVRKYCIHFFVFLFLDKKSVIYYNLKLNTVNLLLIKIYPQCIYDVNQVAWTYKNYIAKCRASNSDRSLCSKWSDSPKKWRTKTILYHTSASTQLLAEAIFLKRQKTFFGKLFGFLLLGKFYSN